MDVILDTPITSIIPGTSGLRKTVSEFRQHHIVEVYAQSVLNTLGHQPGYSTFVIGGDGRYYNDRLFQRLLIVLAGNGVNKIIIPINLLASTPCCSYMIKTFATTGGFILSASHNPGGADGDAGIKFNIDTGAPAPDEFNHSLINNAKACTSYKSLESSRFARCYDSLDLSMVGMFRVGDTIVEIVDSIKLYSEYALSHFKPSVSVQLLLRHPQFGLFIDSMHAVSGPFVIKVLEHLQQHCNFGKLEDTKTIKVIQQVLKKFPIRCHVFHETPFLDFHGIHPDPSLVNNPELMRYADIDAVSMYDGLIMNGLSDDDDIPHRPSLSQQDSVCNDQKSISTDGRCTTVNPLARRYSLTSLFANQPNTIPCTLGFAFDGDGDRALVVGSRTFLTPSDNLALITAVSWCISSCFEKHRHESPPGNTPIEPSLLSGVARSFPTSSALDGVCDRLGIDVYQTPTGFKYFGSLLDSNLVQLCGEESFGLGLSTIREKDGVIVALLWIHILAYMNAPILNQWKDQLSLILPEYGQQPSRLRPSSAQTLSSASQSAGSMLDNATELKSDLSDIMEIPPAMARTVSPLPRHSLGNIMKLNKDVSQSQTWCQPSQPHQRKGLPDYQPPLSSSTDGSEHTSVEYHNDHSAVALSDSSFQHHPMNPHPVQYSQSHIADQPRLNDFESPLEEDPSPNLDSQKDTCSPFPSVPLISLQSIQHAFYLHFGRTYYIRLDYHSVPQPVESTVYTNLGLFSQYLSSRQHQKEISSDIQKLIHEAIQTWDKNYDMYRQKAIHQYNNDTGMEGFTLGKESQFDSAELDMKDDKHDDIRRPQSPHPIRKFLNALTKAEEFIYTDPVTNVTSSNHGFILEFTLNIGNPPLQQHHRMLSSSPYSQKQHYRCVVRRSGTATGSGCTLRLYIERFIPSPLSPDQPDLTFKSSADNIRKTALSLQNQQMSLPHQLNLPLGSSLFEFVNVLTHLTQLVDNFPQPSAIT